MCIIEPLFIEVFIFISTLLRLRRWLRIRGASNTVLIDEPASETCLRFTEQSNLPIVAISSKANLLQLLFHQLSIKPLSIQLIAKKFHLCMRSVSVSYTHLRAH